MKTMASDHLFLSWVWNNRWQCFGFNPIQPGVAFHIETSHLICIANQMTGVYMKCSMGWNGLRYFLAYHSEPSQT